MNKKKAHYLLKKIKEIEHRIELENIKLDFYKQELQKYLSE